MDVKERKYIEKVTSNYCEKEQTKIDEIKALDSKAKKPVLIFSYVFGTIASLILGFGMCVAMGVILEKLMWMGIVVGVIGIALCLLTYPLHKKIMMIRKNKYKHQILQLSNQLLNQ